ncbi:GNAT family N-acetyltransferase [Microbacterium sp. G2-8]|uniref:GNAT family N-acetyltransferase n=1 Tax=Microbacterium sp. G2-8 TaxID=2842454 RepID=UPI001C890038|nr:GNAT family N-acetyltransferase [Microbacterium sp. G2-8]
MTLRIEPLHVPASVDAPDAGDWLAYVDIVHEVLEFDSGTDWFSTPADEWLVGMHNTRYVAREAFVARDGTRIVGIGKLEYEREAGSDSNIDIAIRVDARGTGVDDALLAHLERIAQERGRRRSSTFAFVRPEEMATAEAALLRPTSGFGAVPRDAYMTDFFLRHGYALGQVERVSAFDLQGSYEQTERMLDAALAKAGPDYEPVWWQTPTPDEYADGYAAAITRMNTDVPSGDLTWDEEPWDGDRVRYREGIKQQAGQIMAVTGVIHRPTGEFVAFSELVIGRDRSRVTETYGTLVLQEHRGHRLGTIVKCLGLLRWHELVPDSPVVQTFNAEENRFMLDVNEAVGFRPVCWSGEWQKELT